jgi:hypothetical protein
MNPSTIDEEKLWVIVRYLLKTNVPLSKELLDAYICAFPLRKSFSTYSSEQCAPYRQALIDRGFLAGCDADGSNETNDHISAYFIFKHAENDRTSSHLPLKNGYKTECLFLFAGLLAILAGLYMFM